jgi:hypothetical protein
MISKPLSDIEIWTQNLTLFMLGSLLIGTLIAWIVMLAMRPRSVGEWAEMAKATVITVVIARAFLNRFYRPTIDPTVDFLFWLFCTALAGFFAVYMIGTWGSISWQLIRRNKESQIYVMGGLLLILLVVVLLVALTR